MSRKDKELVATVKRPAEAESYKVETIAQGRRFVIVNITFGIISANFLVLMCRRHQPFSTADSHS